MIILMPEAGPGGMPRELRACQQPPIPVNKSKTRILAGEVAGSIGERAGGEALGLVASTWPCSEVAAGGASRVARGLAVLEEASIGGASLPPCEASGGGGSCCQTEAAAFWRCFLLSSKAA